MYGCLYLGEREREKGDVNEKEDESNLKKKSATSINCIKFSRNVEKVEEGDCLTDPWTELRRDGCDLCHAKALKGLHLLCDVTSRCPKSLCCWKLDP